MNLPPISDGTVSLRPFAPDDGDHAVGWVAGPASRERSATDGGPSLDEGRARHLVDKLLHSATYTVVLDEVANGWASIHRDGHGCGHLQIVLANPRLWNQGVGTRVVRLLLRVAFDHLELDAVAVSDIPETAEAARIAFEDCGCSMVARRPGERDGEDQVLVDYHLDAVSYTSSEQRVLLVHHGRTAPEVDGLLLGSTMDPPLDHVGRAQSEALALSGLLYGTSECICAPSKRARATAEQAFAAHDIPIAIADEWEDRNWGEYSGQSLASIERDDQGLLRDPRAGESEAEFSKRLQAALKALPYGGHLAIVTHGVVIAALLRHCCPALAAGGGLGTGLGIAHGSISELRRGPSGWRVVRINDDRHQQGRRPTADCA